jgi:hypothetical protein
MKVVKEENRKKKIAHVALTEDEYKELLRIAIEKQKTSEHRVSLSEVLREWIIPNLNGHNPKIVSQPPTQPVSEQKNKEDPIQVSQVVSENVSNIDSTQFEFKLQEFEDD